MSTIVAHHQILVLLLMFLACIRLGAHLGCAIGLPSPGWKPAAYYAAVITLLPAVVIMSAHHPHDALLNVDDIVCLVLVFLSAFQAAAARVGFIKPTGR